MTKKKARRALKQSLMNLFFDTYGKNWNVTRRESNNEFKTVWARARSFMR